MATSLENKLNSIYLEKQTKILPQNIKKDVTVFGVTGTYEGSGGGSSDYNVKLVPTNGRITAYITKISENLDTSSVTMMDSMFGSCTNLTEIPLLDTSNVTNMGSMFINCTSLTTIPLLNTGSVTNMRDMFRSCTNLSDESLNNILAMCTNATSYTDTKTLIYLGLTSAQATKCTTLSNYEAFTAAGWTTGY